MFHLRIFESGECRLTMLLGIRDQRGAVYPSNPSRSSIFDNYGWGTFPILWLTFCYVCPNFVAALFPTVEVLLRRPNFSSSSNVPNKWSKWGIKNVQSYCRRQHHPCMYFSGSHLFDNWLSRFIENIIKKLLELQRKIIKFLIFEL